MSFKITWYGHAALGFETGGYRVLVDPFFTGNPAASTTADQVAADFILISHGHNDHVGDTLAIARRTGALVISNNEIANWVGDKGVKSHGQHLGGGYKHPFGYLKLTLALHGSSLPDGANGGNPAGFLLTTGEGKKIYMAGDTGLFGDMSLIGEEGLDLAVIPIGDNYTMGPSDAAEAAHMIQPKLVIPMHYNTWPLIEQSPEAFKKDVESRFKIPVHIMEPGDTQSL